jgi:hypothetical protein
VPFLTSVNIMTVTVIVTTVVVVVVMVAVIGTITVITMSDHALAHAPVMRLHSLIADGWSATPALSR